MNDKTTRYLQILELLKKETPYISNNQGNGSAKNKDFCNTLPDKLFDEYLACSSLSDKIFFYNKIDINKFSGNMYIFLKNLKIKVNLEIMDDIKRKDFENKRRIFKQHISHLMYEFYRCSKNKNFKMLFPLKEMLFLFIKDYHEKYGPF